jgi:hypothetical protein
MMSRLVKLLVRLYPFSWRNRYEAEFEALLEDVPPTWRGSVDILKEAVAMQLRRMSVVAFGGLAGLLLGLCVFLAIPNTYVSKSLIVLERQSTNRKGYTDRVRIMAVNVLSRSTLATLIHTYQLYPTEL